MLSPVIEVPFGLDALAESERLDWFVRGRLANVALERAGYDRQAAVELLERAIADLAMREAEARSATLRHRTCQ